MHERHLLFHREVGGEFADEQQQPPFPPFLRPAHCVYEAWTLVAMKTPLRFVLIAGAATIAEWSLARADRGSFCGAYRSYPFHRGPREVSIGWPPRL
jgi:hypothetical protein